MKQGKKLLALALALVMLLALTACGGKKTDNTSVAGTYYGTGLSLFSDDEWTDMNEYYGNAKEDNYLQLNADGTGSGTVNDMPIEFKWTLKGTELNLEAILSDFDKDLYKQLDMEPTTTGQLEGDTITLTCYLGTTIGMRFTKSGAADPTQGTDTQKGEFPLSFADVYGGDWVGLTRFYDCTGDFETNNGNTCHALARFLFDKNGNCTPFLAISVDENGGLTDVSVTYDAADNDMDLHGKLLGKYELTDDSFVQFKTDESLLYVNLSVKKDSSSALNIVGCLRPIGQSWSDSDYLRLQPEYEEKYNAMTLEEIIAFWGLSVTPPTAASAPQDSKPTPSAGGGDTSGFDGEFIIGDKQNAAINYPTNMLKPAEAGGMEYVSGDFLYFDSGMYVYPQGSSSIEGSNHSMSNNFSSEKEFHDDPTYTVGNFPCHHIRFVNIWDNVVHCYLLDTTGLGSSDVAAVYFKVEMASDDQLPLAEAIISPLHLR